MSVSVQCEHLHTILNNPFLSISVSVSMSGSVNTTLIGFFPQTQGHNSTGKTGNLNVQFPTQGNLPTTTNFKFSNLPGLWWDVCCNLLAFVTSVLNIADPVTE